MDVKLYKDETVETAKIIDKNGKVVAQDIGGWRLDDDWFSPNEIKLVDMPSYFSFLVFHSSNYSPANISHSYIMYSTTPTLKKFTEIDSPVNEWQVLNRNGSENMVVGFYKNDKGNYLIDRVVPDDKEAECNSCQGYNLEVLKITKKGLVVIDKHPYEFERDLFPCRYSLHVLDKPLVERGISPLFLKPCCFFGDWAKAKYKLTACSACFCSCTGCFF